MTRHHPPIACNQDVAQLNSNESIRARHQCAGGHREFKLARNAFVSSHHAGRCHPIASANRPK